MGHNTSQHLTTQHSTTHHNNLHHQHPTTTTTRTRTRTRASATRTSMMQLHQQATRLDNNIKDHNQAIERGRNLMPATHNQPHNPNTLNNKTMCAKKKDKNRPSSPRKHLHPLMWHATGNVARVCWCKCVHGNLGDGSTTLCCVCVVGSWASPPPPHTHRYLTISSPRAPLVPMTPNKSYPLLRTPRSVPCRLRCFSLLEHHKW